VLVVDHDPTFGALLSAAFACRGHHGQSTDRMADALRLLVRDMYDPVIIDLHLSDGSGLDLLENAIRAGLLTPGASVILASHDFGESPDEVSPSSVLDLDGFLSRELASSSRVRLADMRFSLCDLSHERSMAA
jgi:CheY-like chemotaxis protein